MFANVVPAVIDWMILLFTSPLFWLFCAGMMFIVLVVMPRNPFSKAKETNE